ncbi:MAG: tetratricopeptide repeat protein [Opitutales bacterium]|nr:tetratricopeptide repeat protein [Opitutales bacterium]
MAKRKGDTVPSAGRISRGRLWVFRVAALALPLLLLLLLEIVLRVAGYGYPTQFFLRSEIAGEPVYVENRDYTRRFFPDALARSLHPAALPVDKGEETCRIFVLGESAAMGDPESAYGVSRFLEVMLRERYPGVRFEVVNVAVTAINSHVVREIARDCAGMDGDLWIVYMGNNEVVGPFGAGTVFGPQAPRLGLIRARMALGRTRVGQALDGLAQSLRSRADAPTEWRGLELFIEQQVSADDPRMDTIYRHFEANLADILDRAAGAGAGVVLSTVATNLRDCPPFGSAHAEGFHDKERWREVFESGLAHEGAGDHEAALAAYENAAALDGNHAELHYRMAVCLEALGREDAARTAYLHARDLDTQRVRADSRLNEIISAEAARRSASAGFFDAAEALGAGAPLGLPGLDVFYEHVHFNFAGNYRLAAGLMEAAEEHLPDRVRARDSGAPLPTPEGCAAALGFTDFDRAEVLDYVRDRLRRPPFTFQSDNAERVEALGAEVTDLRAAMTPEALKGMRALYEAALDTAPSNDWMLRERFARFLENSGDLAAAENQFRAVLEIVPHYSRARFGLGEILLARGRHAAAAETFAEVLRARPDSVDALNGLGMALSGRGRHAESVGHFRRAAEIQPNSVTTRVNWGLALARQGDVLGAMGQYRRALEIDPSSAAAHINLGQLHAERGDRAAAKRHYRAAVEADPSNAVARYNLANALSADDPAEATKHFGEAARLDPTFADARYNYGIGLARAGRVVEAAEEFGAAVRLQPHRVNARMNYGIALMRLGRAEEASEQFEEVLRVEPDNTDARRFLAELEAR